MQPPEHLFRGKLLLLFAVAAAVLMGDRASLPAQEPETEIPGAPHLLPQDTLAYIRLDNADDLREELANSPLGRMLSDPQMQPFVGDVTQFLSELFQIVGDRFGITLAELLAIPSGQVAVALMPGNISERQEDLVRDESEDDESEEAIRRRIEAKRRQQNSFAAVVMIDAGENIDSLRMLVEQFENAVQQDQFVRRTTEIDGIELVHLLPTRSGPPEIEIFERMGVYVLGIGHKTAEKVLNQWLDRSEEPTFAERSEFGSIMSRCVGAEETRPQVTFFVDPYHIAERAVKRGGAGAFIWPIVEGLGLGKIRGLGGSVFRAGEDFESIAHFHMLIDPPRDGIFGVLRPEVVDTLPPDWVPGDVSSYTTLKWDLKQTYENVDKLVAKFQGEDPLKRMVEEPLKRATGIALQEDLFDNVTGRYVLCTWLEKPIKLNSQSQSHALELEDPEAFREVIEQLRIRFPQYVKVETVSGVVVYSAAEQLGGDQFPDALRRPEYALMILGDWAVFCDSSKFLERMTLANRGGIERLVEEPDYDLIASELGGKLDGEEPFLISYARSADSYRQLYELVKSPDTRRFLSDAAGENEFVGRIVALLERNELPPFDEFEKYFAPSGAFAYDEPAGMHFGSFTLTASE